jgi:cell division protein FtsI/penicillin-binding protein 2
MGSIMKPLTVAAGLDAGVIAPSTTYNDRGFVEADGYTIYNYDKKGRGVVDMHRVLGNSLNTGAAFVVGKLGNARFARYMKGYGLGTETGVDLPGEVSGLIDNLDSPRNVEYITASFGQGIAVTPIAMTRALASLANGGTLVTPHVASSIDYAAGITKNVVHAPATRVLEEETSEAITKILVRVVDEYLAGGRAKLPHYSIAAKTGTAQIADPSGDGYYSDRYLHSFFGYFPAYEPRFLIFLYAEEPKGVSFASETLTEPFMDLAGFLINYYNLPPDR